MGKANSARQLGLVRIPKKGSSKSWGFWNEREQVIDLQRFDDPNESYLVDPASSHMLVSKIKPCMSKYKLLYCETANGSLNQL